MKSVLSDSIKRARSRATPLLGIRTQDWRGTANALSNLKIGDQVDPVISWDFVRGVRAVNEEGAQFVGLFYEGTDDPTVQNPLELLVRMDSIREPMMCLMVLPSDSIFEMQEGALALTQAISNLRDGLKQVRASLVILAPDLKLPVFLQQDVIIFDDPLPDNAGLEAIANNVLEKTKKTVDGMVYDETTVSRAVDLTRGLSGFLAEQSIYMCLTKEGLDLDKLASNQRDLISQTPGLSIISGDETVDDVKGCDALIEYNSLIMKGKVPIRAIVVFDEIEKMLAGAGGDSSGVSSDALGVWLQEMQNKKYLAELLLGPPGTGKTFVAQTLGNTFGVPTVQFDMGAMKGSGLVGQAEKAARQGWRVLDAISGGNALVIATCNSVKVLPPEVRRRFNLGTFFVDLPNQDGLDALWDYYKGKYELSDKTPETCEGWTGAEVSNACRVAWVTGMALDEAARRITPVIQTMPEQINRLRSDSNGRYQSADRVGVYTMPVMNQRPAITQAREISL